MGSANYDYQKPRQDNISARYQKDGAELFIGRIKNRPNPTGAPSSEVSRPILSLVTPYGGMDACAGSEYEDLAMMSLDGLLRPISLAGDGGLPRYCTTTSASQNTYSAPVLKLIGYSTGGGSLAPIESGNVAGGSGVFVTLSGCLGVSQIDANPVKNPTGVGSITAFIDSRSIGSKGHDFDLIAQRTALAAGQSLVTCLGSGQGAGHVPTYSNDYRLMALRGPLLIQGWGYDLEGKPVPNSADSFSNASQGIFTTTSLTNKFMPNYLQKSKAWPVAPLDLRLDRKRGVWTIPQTKLLLGTAVTGITANGQGLMVLTDSSYVDDDGVGVTAYVNAIDKLGFGLTSGTKSLMYYNPSVNEVWLIGGGSGGSGGGGSITISAQSCSGYSTGVGFTGFLSTGISAATLSNLTIGGGLTLVGGAGSYTLHNSINFAKFTGGCFSTGTGTATSFQGTGAIGDSADGTTLLRRLVYGPGLRVGEPYRACTGIFNIDTNLSAIHDGTRITPQSSIEDSRKKWNRLGIGAGLAARYSESNDCDLNVGLSFGLSASLTGLYGLRLGCGLAGNSTGVGLGGIQLNIGINGITGGIAGFSAGHGLNTSRTSGTEFCNTATFAVIGTGLSNSLMPSVLTGIYCSGGQIYGRYIKFLVSTIGGITGYVSL